MKFTEKLNNLFEETINVDGDDGIEKIKVGNISKNSKGWKTASSGDRSFISKDGKVYMEVNDESLLEFKVPKDYEGKLKHVKKKGNVITFKNKDVEFRGEQRRQIIVNKVKKSKNGVSLEGEKMEFLGGDFAKTKTFKSEEELVDAVDWDWISKNAMR